MVKRKLVKTTGMLVVSAMVYLWSGSGMNVQAQTEDAGGHGNKFGKLRSTTHEQRLAAAANKAAMMEKVKAKRNATGTKAPDASGSSVNTPDTAK